MEGIWLVSYIVLWLLVVVLFLLVLLLYRQLGIMYLGSAAGVKALPILTSPTSTATRRGWVTCAASPLSYFSAHRTVAHAAYYFPS